MKVQIIVDKNLVMVDDSSINIDCSKFKEQFVFCEVNEKEKWIEKKPFNGKEQPKKWNEIEEFISIAKLKSNQPNSYSIWDEVNKAWIEDTNLKKLYVYTVWKSERQNKVDNLEVVYMGIVYQGDELSQTRMARAIAVMDDTETTKWVAKDNSIQTLNKADLSAILKEAGIKQTLIWNENRPEVELGGL